MEMHGCLGLPVCPGTKGDQGNVILKRSAIGKLSGMAGEQRRKVALAGCHRE